MVPQQLEPSLELLREEYVLVQAWKKTASHIRYHNWISDTLALDRAAVNLPAFLSELRKRLQSPESWQNDPLRIVLAPKSQRWRVREGVWEPVEKGATSARLRPLAHVADQVVATALMLCLADRVEMDPSRKSGGALHRLHCFCLEFDGACEVQRRVPTDWVIEPIDVSGYGSFSLAS